MSESSKPAAASAAGSAAAATDALKDVSASASKVADAAVKANPKQNPALKMMGLPRIKLPSRNWMIFLGLTGSIASAITYDRWQTRKVKEKWCRLVSHMADEPLETTSLPRTVTVYLSAPPGDGLRSAREHFHDYVKPILVAAAMDWDVVEGRKEGDVRYKTAERVRRRRRIGGEGTPLPPEEYSVENVRQGFGVHKYNGVAGDLVIGRHTWKEYIRGLHEGWLGPVDAPPHVDIAMGTVPEDGSTVLTAAVNASTPAATPVQSISETVSVANADTKAATQSTTTDTTPVESPDDKQAKEEEEKPKPRQPPPYIAPEAYTTALASRQLPDALEPSAPISCPHILGFRNTPIRLYRYFTRRRLADEIGRQVAAAVIGHNQPFDVATAVVIDSPSAVDQLRPEQSATLEHEERDWWKTVRQPRKEHEESVLIEAMTFDDRIANRMRKFVLTAEDEQRASALTFGENIATKPSNA